METILQRTNHITMFIAFGVSWILVNTAVGSIVCDNTFSDIISKRGGVNALEKYYENLSPICRLWQSKMDSNFIWHEMSFGEAAIYAGSISVLGAIIELTYLYFRKEDFSISGNGSLSAFVLLRALLLLAFTVYAVMPNY